MWKINLFLLCFHGILYIFLFFHFGAMKTCVLYFSRTGKTRCVAEAISGSTKAPALDIASCEPLVVEDYDVLIIGTPVEGFRPTKEILSFIEQMPQTKGKKAIVFCTYALWKVGTLKTLARELSKKGYSTILSVSKRGVKPDKTDFSSILDQVRRATEE